MCGVGCIVCWRLCRRCLLHVMHEMCLVLLALCAVVFHLFRHHCMCIMRASQSTAVRLKIACCLLRARRSYRTRIFQGSWFVACMLRIAAVGLVSCACAAMMPPCCKALLLHLRACTMIEELPIFAMRTVVWSFKMSGRGSDTVQAPTY